MIILVLLILAAIAFAVAWFSMSDFLDFPNRKYFGVFLVRNINELTPSMLQRIEKLSNQLSRKYDPMVISFERLHKGGDKALAICMPQDMVAQLPELNLLELEDYSEKVFMSRVLSYDLSLTSSKFSLSDFRFENITLEPDEHLFFQIVTSPFKGSSQTSFRVAIVATDSGRRIAIAKKLEQDLRKMNLIKSKVKQSSLKNFESFKKRGVVPREVKKLSLTNEELLKILLG